MPVTLSLAEGSVGSVAVNELLIRPLEPGKATLRATQSGDDHHKPAPTVSRTFCVNPKQPSIRLEGKLLISSSSSGNQWYKNGALIEGAVEPEYQPTTEGVYTVLVQTGGCNSEPAEGFAMKLGRPLWDTNISKEVTEKRKLHLAWQPVFADAQYTIQVSQNPEMEGSHTFSSDQAYYDIWDHLACTMYYFRVQATFNGIVSEWSEVLSIRVRPAYYPHAFTASGEAARACTGESIVIKATEGFAYYEWSNGSQESDVIATSSDILSVRVANTPGCWSEWSFSIYVVFDDPAKASLSQDGMVLTASAGAGYHWLLNGEVLPFKTRSITAQESGQYQVNITDENGCSSLSNIIIVTVTSLEEEFADIIVYPNPSEEKLLVESRLLITRIQLFTATGKTVMEKRMHQSKFEGDISSYPAGLYFLELSINGKVIRYKIVKR